MYIATIIGIITIEFNHLGRVDSRIIKRLVFRVFSSGLNFFSIISTDKTSGRFGEGYFFQLARKTSCQLCLHPKSLVLFVVQFLYTHLKVWLSCSSWGMACVVWLESFERTTILSWSVEWIHTTPRAKFCRANRNSEFYPFLLFYREVDFGALKFAAWVVFVLLDQIFVSADFSL